MLLILLANDVFAVIKHYRANQTFNMLLNGALTVK